MREMNNFVPQNPETFTVRRIYQASQLNPVEQRQYLQRLQVNKMDEKQIIKLQFSVSYLIQTEQNQKEFKEMISNAISLKKVLLEEEKKKEQGSYYNKKEYLESNKAAFFFFCTLVVGALVLFKAQYTSDGKKIVPENSDYGPTVTAIIIILATFGIVEWFFIMPLKKTKRRVIEIAKQKNENNNLQKINIKFQIYEMIMRARNHTIVKKQAAYQSVA